MRAELPEMLRLATVAEPRVETPEPPATLTPDTFAERLYDALGPLAQLDPEVGWSLLILCNAIGTMFQLVEDLVRDTPDGPGWSMLVDVDRCPPEALAWLAQFVGVRILPGSTPDQARIRIESTDGFQRGTRQAMIAAARAAMTDPSGPVIFRERDGAHMGHPESPEYAYCLSVITYQNDTPEADWPAGEGPVGFALNSQKPGGILLSYRVATGQDWLQVSENFATWADVKAHYPDWASVKTDEPG